MMENREMKREDWYNSAKFKKLRLLEHVAHDIRHKTQYLYDILEIILDDRPELLVFDKFTIVERQLRVVQLEADRLTTACRDLTHMLSPHKFNEEKDESNRPDNQQGESDIKS